MVEEWTIFFKNWTESKHKMNKMYIQKPKQNTCPAKQQTETHCTETLNNVI